MVKSFGKSRSKIIYSVLLFMFSILYMSGCGGGEEDSLSSDKSIESFIFRADDNAWAEGDYEAMPSVQGSTELSVTVPLDTSLVDLVPTIVFTGSSITPNSGEAITFEDGIGTIYTITAEDGSVKKYTVMVNKRLGSRFGFLGTHGPEKAILFDKWASLYGIDLVEESNHYAKDLGIGWSRELSFMFVPGAGYQSITHSQYLSKKLEYALNAGLKIVATILVEEGDFMNNKEEMKEWLAAAVEENKNNIDYWQVHNEVGKIGPEGPRYTDPDDYIDLLKTCVEVIKNSCENCKVMMGSTEPESTYYTKVIEEGDPYVDAYDYHIFDSSEFEASLDSFKDFTSKVREKSPEKLVFVTEMATYSGEPYTSQQLPLPHQTEKYQAETLIKWFVKAFYYGGDIVFWQSLVEMYSFLGLVDGLFDFTGIVYNGLCASGPNDDCDDAAIDNGAGIEKEAYHSLKTLIGLIDQYVSVEELTEGQYKFTVEGKDVYVFWCDSGNCGLPVQITGTVKVTDYLGNVEILNANDILLTESPIFVEDE